MEFNMTKEGCSKAKQYLISIGRYQEFLDNCVSVDGYSLVAFANHWLKKGK